MQCCTNCAHDALVGFDAVSLCTNCGAIATNVSESAVAPIVGVLLILSGVGLLTARLASAFLAHQQRSLSVS